MVLSEPDQLSPVALSTKDATPLSLLPLQWHHYNITPLTVLAINKGFTVMIQDSLSAEVAYISSGPLSEKYNFSHIHFHWGEDDETGSGHSIDGLRYPLEMHIVHVKKGCANLSEARGTKDGLAIAVHLFSLGIEGSTHLNQLTAILQFIRKPNCCAKLYPSSLSEIVQPFSRDYFLYSGAVPGPSQQSFRIIWLVSRHIKPISSQQLEQFRSIYDEEGNLMRSNSNNPYPLQDRPLYLISPSEKTSETMEGIPHQPTRSALTFETNKSIEINNAEFKCLVALEEVEEGSCAICPHPNHATYKETGNLKHPTRISLASGNECEINLQENTLIIRNSDTSTEQACVWLTKPQSLLSTITEPTWGYLGLKKECIDVSDRPKTDSSSEIVFNKIIEPEKYRNEADISLATKSKYEDAETQKYEDVHGKQNSHIIIPLPMKLNSAVSKQSHDKEVLVTKSKSRISNSHFCMSADSKLQTECLLIKKTAPENSLYDLIGELKMIPESKRKFKKDESNKDVTLLYEVNDKKEITSDKKEYSKNKDINYNKIVLSFPPSKEEPSEKRVHLVGNNNTEQSRHLNLISGKDKSGLNIHEKLKDDSKTLYYINKITPVTKSIQTNSLSEKKLYYAQPIQEKNKVTSGKASEPRINANGVEYERSDVNKFNIETQCNKDSFKENIVSNKFNENRITNNLQNFKSNEYFNVRKQVLNVLSNTNFEKAQTINSLKIKTTIGSHPGSEFITDKNTQPISKDIKDLPAANISVDISQTTKSHTVYQFKQYNKNNTRDSESTFNDTKDPRRSNHSSSNLNNNNKLIVSNELLQLENSTFGKQDSKLTNKNKSLRQSSAKQKTLDVTNVKDILNSSRAKSSSRAESSDDVVLEENIEGKTIRSSQKSKKRITFQTTGPTYKIASHHPDTIKQTSSQHLVTIKKVEIPDPFFLSREPKQPLVEYEAFPMGIHRQLETLETEEMSSKVKTIKTHATFKKGKQNCNDGCNIKITSGNSKKSSTAEESVSRESPHSSIKNSGSSNDQQDSIKIEGNGKGVKKITIDFYPSRNPSFDENSCLKHNEKKDQFKNTRIVIGSYQPRKFVTSEGNNVSNRIESATKTYFPVNYKSDHQTNLPSDSSDESSTNISTVELLPASDHNNHIQHIQSSKHIHEPRAIGIDAATSNSSILIGSEIILNQHSKGLQCDDIQEEPTRDPGFGSLERDSSPHYQSKEPMKTDIVSIKAKNTENENNFPSSYVNLNTLNQSDSSDKADKDTVAYIHFPGSVLRSPSKRFNSECDSTSDLNNQVEKETQTEQDAESDNARKLSKTSSKMSKTKIAKMHQPLSENEISQEEFMSSHNYDSSEDPNDSSYCDITYKSKTKMELPSGQTAFIKSIAQFKFKPNIMQTTAEAKATTNQATITTEDKCCEVVDFYYNNDNYVDTTTNTEDELKENVNFSPIRIQTDQTLVKCLPSLEFINHWNKSVSGGALLENNGNIVRATLLVDEDLPGLRGGPLQGDYVFAELHFHWGRKDCCGADHIIDNQRHTMEAHFSYFKKEYGSVKEARTHIDGLAIVAIQLNVGSPPNLLFGELIKDIRLIREANTRVYVPAESLFSWIKQTVEESQEYFTYQGTMTSEPPFVEAVTWLVFKKPIFVCCQQSLEFRKLMSPNGELLLETYRTPRPLNNRPVYYIPLSSDI